MPGILYPMQEFDGHICSQVLRDGHAVLPGIVHAVILKIKGNGTAFPVFCRLGYGIYSFRPGHIRSMGIGKPVQHYIHPQVVAGLGI